MSIAPRNNVDLPHLGASLATVFATCAVVAAGVPMAAAQELARSRPTEYSVINLAPNFAQGLLNQRGQAAVQFWNVDQTSSTVFFDGQRIVPVASLGGEPTIIWGINNGGAVVGESVDTSQPAPVTRAFIWKPGLGTRALPGPIYSRAFAINDQGQVVGMADAGLGREGRAIRWNPDGTVTYLGPVPAALSTAYDINASGMSTGRADALFTIWNRDGTATNLGAIDRTDTIAQYINARGEVAGTGYWTGFFWSRGLGMITFSSSASSYPTINGLNDKGEVAGVNNTPGPHGQLDFVPFLWSARQGMRYLPLVGSSNGIVFGLNNRSEMVGFKTPADSSTRQAAYWRGVADPVDLNSRMYRAPAGLVLYAGEAINDRGDIIADSNAGAVLLRPGRQGTAAPVLGPITSPALEGTILTPNASADFTVGFVDSNANETHVASATVSDGCPQAAPTVREVRGTGEVDMTHVFCRSGMFDIGMKLTDRAGNSSEVHTWTYVYDMSIATLSGQGVLSGEAASASRSGKELLQFALYVPLAGGAAEARQTGRAAPGLVRVSRPFSFDGNVVGQPVRDTQSIRVAGTGRLNGRGGYRFVVETSSGNDKPGIATRLHLRISHTDAATNAEIVDYDNGAATMATARVAAATGAAPGMPLVQGKVQVVEPAARR